MTDSVNAIRAYNLGQEYLERVHGVYGTWLDVTRGLDLLVNRHATQQSERILTGDVMAALNARVTNYHYANGHTVKRTARVLDIMDWADEGGPHRLFLSGMCVTTLYSFWEHHYRLQIEKALGLPRDGLQSHLIADLAAVRHAFLKHGQLGTERTAKNTCIRVFAYDQPIGFSSADIADIVRQVGEYVNAVAPRPEGVPEPLDWTPLDWTVAPGFRTDAP